MAVVDPRAFCPLPTAGSAHQLVPYGRGVICQKCLFKDVPGKKGRDIAWEYIFSFLFTSFAMILDVSSHLPLILFQ